MTAMNNTELVTKYYPVRVRRQWPYRIAPTSKHIILKTEMLTNEDNIIVNL